MIQRLFIVFIVKVKYMKMYKCGEGYLTYQRLYYTRVLILDGNSEYVAHASGKYGFSEKKYPICASSRSNQMP